MKRNPIKLRQAFIIVLVMICSCLIIQAQSDSSTSSGFPRTEEYPKPILETLAKQRIEEEEKEYDRLLKRSEEAMKISEELENSFILNKKLSSKDTKKLKDLEKLLKKIRSDLGGDDDDENFEEKPTSMGDALKALRKNTLNLFDEIKQTSRHTISVVAIESSNVILKIVKFLRFGN